MRAASEPWDGLEGMMSEEYLPVEVSRGKLKIAVDLEIEVVHLDNGMRVVPEEDFKRMMIWIDSGGDAMLAYNVIEEAKRAPCEGIGGV